jgi:cytochrome P450
LIAEVEERLRSRRTKEGVEDTEKPTNRSGEPNDFLQWSIEQALETGDRRMMNPRTLAGRILLLNLVSIHTSSLTVTNLILDLASSTPQLINELRAEVTSCLAETGGVWTKAALSKMEKLDSVFRESARLNTLVVVGLRRRVVAKEGITTPSGVHIPYGNLCAVPSLAVLSDDGKYPGADEFRPFRFVEMREQINSGNRPEDHVKRSRMSFPATSCDYLAFGNGRQACPGRFFAAAELKLMVAYMLLHYDIEMLKERPANKWVGLFRLPPPTAKIRVCRRKV